jgi:hypothetical protein
MRRIVLGALVVAAFAAVLALMGGAEAHAAEWTVSDTKTVYREAKGTACGPGSIDVHGPYGAYNAQAVSPGVGGLLDATDENWNDGQVQVTSAVPINAGNGVRFTIQPVGSWCGDGRCDPEWMACYPALDWSTYYDYENQPYKIRYELRKRLVLKGNAARLADRAIARSFRWWYDGLVGKPARCRVHGNRARCVGIDAIGDASVRAVVKLRLIPRTGQKPVWSYRLNARQLDEYCFYVTHDGNCTTRIKQRRSRLALPSSVRARTVG